MEELIKKIESLPTQIDIKNHWEWKVNKDGKTYCHHEGKKIPMIRLDDVLKIIEEYDR